ncbi:MAG: DUF3800 domain-containing protein [Candidatus Methanomethylophilaceae archaeon]|nr:DUF3800 domain-containing protein [Candidatus Methanomethylophilaceae archaeon]
MFLTYMDESGKPNYNDAENEYVLAAITIHESEYRHVEEELSKIKTLYFQDMDPEDVEIHATDIISRKNVFNTMDLSKRLQLLKDVLGILGKIECTVNCTLIRKDLLLKRKPDVDGLAYKFLFERLCMTHEKLNRELIKKGSDPQFGILFMDSIQPQINEGIKTKVREMIKEGTEFTDNEYIIEDVVFVDSRYRSMSQIVDCVAYVVRRYHRLCFRDNSNASEMAFYKECYDSIAPHIRRSNNGKLKGAGLKIYPKK